MGTSLTGKNISASYLGLLKTTDNAIIGGTAKRLTDGGGNDSPLFLSTSQLGIGVTPTEALTISSGNIQLSNDNKLQFGTSDVYIQGTTATDNIQIGLQGATKLTLHQTDGLTLAQYGSGSITGTVTQRLGVTSSGQVVEIPIGSGAVDGSGATGQATFWTDSDTISGDDDFYWDNTNKRLGIGTSSPSYEVGIGDGTTEKFVIDIGSITSTDVTLATNDRNISIDASGSGARSISFKTGSTPFGGTERMKISAGGGVTIENDLTVKGDVFRLDNGTALHRLDNDDTNLIIEADFNNSLASSTIQFSIDNDEKMRLDSDGNLGIGVSPSAKLHIYTTVGRDFKVDQGTANKTILSNDYGLTLKAGGGYNLDLDTGNTLGAIRFLDNGSETMKIDSSGNVNLITSESELLFYSDYTVGNTDRAKIKVIGAGGGSGYGGDLTFHTKNPSNIYSERMRIDSSGVLQVRNDLPTLQLYNTDISLTTDQVIGTLDFYKSDPSGSGVGVSSSIQVRSGSSIGANSYMAFHTDGGSGLQNLERMRITQDGNVGINDTNPTNRLDVNETGTSTYVIHAQKSGTSLGGIYVDGSSNAEFYLKASGNSTKVRIDTAGDSYFNGGNVGINQTNPSSKLHITNDAGGSGGYLKVTDVTYGGDVRFGMADGINNDAVLGTYTNNGMGFVTNSAQAMYIDNDSNVGINKTPEGFSQLEVKADTNGKGALLLDSNATTQPAFTHYEVGGSAGWETGMLGSGSSYSFAWSYGDINTSGNHKMTLTNGGLVGIGTSSITNSRVQIKGANNTTNAFADGLKVTSNNETVSTQYNWNGINGSGDLLFATGGSERARITSGGYFKASNNGTYASSTGTYHELKSDASGNVVADVRNTNATDPYGVRIIYSGATINATSNYCLQFEDATATRFIVYSNGNVVNSNNSYGAISDVKLKENITDASSKLDDLLQVKVRNFNYIGDDKKQLGVIAQELEEIFPSMIDESTDFEEQEVPQLDENEQEVLDENGDVVMTTEKVDLGTSTKSVKYSVFVPMLIKAMQEQQDMIQELKAEIDELKKKI